MLKIIKKKEIKVGAIIFGAIFLFFIDRFLKIWALTALYNQKITIIKKWFYLDLYKNKNIAFSIPVPDIITIPLIIIILGLLIYWFLKLARKNFGLQEIGLLFIVIGAISNLIDRLHYGYVIDYINLRFWPVFNIADMMISGGVIILIIILFKHKAKNHPLDKI